MTTTRTRATPVDAEVDLDLDELVDDAPGALEIETVTPTTESGTPS